MKLSTLFLSTLFFVFISCGDDASQSNEANTTQIKSIFNTGETLSVSTGSSIQSLLPDTKLDITTDITTGTSTIIILSGSLKYIP